MVTVEARWRQTMVVDRGGLVPELASRGEEARLDNVSFAS